MTIREKIIETLKELKSNPKIKDVSDTWDGDSAIATHSYLESNDSEDWEEDFKKNNYLINPRIREKLFTSLQNRCDYPIPEILKEFWLSTDGFYARFPYDHDNNAGNIVEFTISFGLMPMEGAFDMLESHRMYESSGSDKLLQWPLVDPERWDAIMEYCYENPNIVDIEAMLANSIFLEFFSSDLVYYTMYNLEKETLYLTYEDGVIPIDLNLETYIEAMLEFKGVVWPWPLMFMREDNIDSSVVGYKNELVEKAKEKNKLLGLDIDFKKYKI